MGMVFTNGYCTLSKSSLWWSCWSIGHNITRCYQEISMRRRPWQWDQLGGYGLHQWVLHPQQIKFMVELLEYRTQHNTVLSAVSRRHHDWLCRVLQDALLSPRTPLTWQWSLSDTRNKGGKSENLNLE